MSRWQAMLIHLGISAFIGTAVIAALLLIWYPPPQFSAAGVERFIYLLIGVDVVLGPLLTLVVFRVGKPGLKVDLALIALVADMLAADPTKRPSSMSEVETRLRAIAPPASLTELVAEYYRCLSPGIPAVASGFGRADTEASAALSTASQSSLAASGSGNPLVASPALTPRKPTSFMRRVQTIALAGCFAAMGWLGLASFREQPTGLKLPPSTGNLPLNQFCLI